MAIQFTPELAHFYLRALLAVARADKQIDASEGTKIDAVIQKRFPGTSLADAMFEPPMREAELMKGVDAEGGPFRTAKIDPREIARMFVEDALDVCIAQDGLSQAEERILTRYAEVFGMPAHEVRAAMSTQK
jgi:tellurite resistance protein